jgi:SAM-dependent methyltransferase
MGTLKASIKYAPYYVAMCGYIYRDCLFDWKYGVETRSRVSLADLNIESESKTLGRNYGPSDPGIFKEMLSCIKVKYEDFTFIDFGSGKGRVVLMASELPFKRIIGVEFSAQLNKVTRNNIDHYKSRTQKCRKIELIEADVTAYELPLEQAILYLFNPFNELIMAKLLANIQRSLAECPRKVFVASLYCVPEVNQLLESSNFLNKVASADYYSIYQNRG